VSEIVWLADTDAQERRQVGGKGANLGRMFAAGLPVPPAFVISTKAYQEMLDCAGISAEIETLIARLDTLGVDELEMASGRIRSAIEQSELSVSLAAALTNAYAQLDGPDARVAVRSSGIAEDTAEASFAGLHDTYLDVCGDQALAVAVRRCWASVWTARAVSYRQRMGFSHRDAKLAVVVQAMIDADVAGVSFTANPLTGATDESVVNASWGLGEAVVSGIITPDEFVLSNRTLAIRRHTLGDKQLEVVADPTAPSGTITRAVDDTRRRSLSLDLGALERLAQLGQQVAAHYGGYPQDIEWASLGGKFFLLQARDITAATFSWDEQVDGWQALPDDDDHVWTRAFADEWWTGAVTPLFYSVRARGQTECHRRALEVMGLPRQANTRVFKYHNAEVYWNASLERREAAKFIPPFLRSPAALGRVPPAWWAEVIEAPFSWFDYVKLYARLTVAAGGMGPTRWIKAVYHELEQRIPEADGLSDDGLRALDDEALYAYLESRIEFFVAFNQRQWAGFFIFAPGLLLWLGDLIGRWYTGSNAGVYADLITGVPRQTVTLQENEQLWHLAQMIRRSPVLQALFEAHAGAAFFGAAAACPEAEAFSQAYAAMVREHGHRGQADRDFWFPRRIENPAGDYNAFKAILSADGSVSPAAAEARTRVLREAAVAEVLENLRAQAFGLFKRGLFRLVLKHVYEFLQVRDDERHYIDRITWSKKRTLLEINRRLLERGILSKPDDYFFLAVDELNAALAGNFDARLTAAKIAGRRHHFEQFDRKLATPPAFLRRGESIDLSAGPNEDGAADGILRGVGTSRGVVTGRARVIKSLAEIGAVEEGDILVCQATDPGWTPVFLVIAGLVLETGGLLAHGSCLSREYGLPAVQITDAMRIIEDGALITVDGALGTVIFDAAPES